MTLRCYCRGHRDGPAHVWEPGEVCPPERVFLADTIPEVPAGPGPVPAAYRSGGGFYVDVDIEEWAISLGGHPSAYKPADADQIAAAITERAAWLRAATSRAKGDE